MLREAINAAVIAILLWVQSWFMERRRRIETARAREEQGEATAHKVVQKLTGRTSPMPPLYPSEPAIRIVDTAVTPAETPEAKKERGSDE